MAEKNEGADMPFLDKTKRKIRLAYRYFWHGLGIFCFRRLRFSAPNGTIVLKVFIKDGAAVSYNGRKDEIEKWSA